MLSVEGGIVAFADEEGIYGNVVVVNHQAGRQTRYVHLNSVTVRVGQSVKMGDSLGRVSSTGRPGTDKPHLHYLHFQARYYSPQG